MNNIKKASQRLGAVAAGSVLVIGGFAITAAPASAASGTEVSPQVSDVSLINGPLVEGPLVSDSFTNLLVDSLLLGQFQ